MIAQLLPAHLYPPATITIAYHSDWTKTHYPEKIAEFKLAPLAMGDVVFLGNSITEEGGDWGKRLGWSHVKNRGISGDVTEGILIRLGEITYSKPKAVFLLIGINDLFNPATTPAYVANNIFDITAIIRKESPGTKMYVQTILPTSTDWIQEKIQQTNNLLKAKASSGTYTLLDTHAVFADAADLMKNEFTRDGVHLNEEGYTAWATFLKNQLAGTSSILK